MTGHVELSRRRRSWLYGPCDLGGDRLSGEGWVVGSGDGSADYEHVGTTLDGLARRGYPALIVDRDAGRADTRDDGHDLGSCTLDDRKIGGGADDAGATGGQRHRKALIE
jgi:hypothetical protein